MAPAHDRRSILARVILLVSGALLLVACGTGVRAQTVPTVPPQPTPDKTMDAVIRGLVTIVAPTATGASQPPRPTPTLGAAARPTSPPAAAAAPSPTRPLPTATDHPAPTRTAAPWTPTRVADVAPPTATVAVPTPTTAPVVRIATATATRIVIPTALPNRVQ
jgi:hypothetical protein